MHLPVMKTHLPLLHRAAGLLAVLAGAAIPHGLHAQATETEAATGATTSTALAGFPAELKKEI